MSDQNGTTTPNVEMTDSAADKGKGKATEQVAPDVDMDEDEDSSDEEEGDAAAAEDDDNMEEIDTTNIVSGTRDRPKIDYLKANEEMADEDDEDDDDDFEPNHDAMED